MIARGLTERHARRAVGLSRASYRYQSRPAPADDQRLQQEIVALAQRHRRYDYRRITAVLRRRGERIHPKRVRWIWQAQALQVPQRRASKRRTGSGSSLPTRATHRGHVWTLDVVLDRTERGQVLKLLVVLDEYTRECHRIAVGAWLDRSAVIDILAEVVAEKGAPEHLRSDNGGEFIADQVQAWLREQGSQTISIRPGQPWENGYAESFIGKLRDECLNEEVYWSVRHAQVLVEWWRQDNEERPHSALGYRTLREVAEEGRSLKESGSDLRGDGASWDSLSEWTSFRGQATAELSLEAVERRRLQCPPQGRLTRDAG